jgi:hypothetical protein
MGWWVADAQDATTKVDHASVRYLDTRNRFVREAARLAAVLSLCALLSLHLRTSGISCGRWASQSQIWTK